MTTAMPRGLPRPHRAPTMRFVELKSEEQLDIQTLHRMRSRLVAERTNLINQLRAILLERGVIFPVGRRKFELGLDGMIAEEEGTLSPRMRKLVSEMRAESGRNSTRRSRRSTASSSHWRATMLPHAD